jgi:2'-5' RNA ligase
LGNVDNNILDYMSQCAESAASEIKKFTYAGQKIAGFPATKSRMIAVYIESNAVLEQLFQTLDQAAIAAGLASENRSFKPHITLAKTREQIKSFSPILLEDFCFTAKELVLYESQSTNEDSHYIPIKKFAFR